MTTPCGEGPTGVKGCPNPEAVWIDFTDAWGLDLAAILCHDHAARLRAGEDIWDDTWLIPVRNTVTGWRNL